MCIVWTLLSAARTDAMGFIPEAQLEREQLANQAQGMSASHTKKVETLQPGSQVVEKPT